ncbi:tetratricopeptide repeat-containing sensor histidine kinase [Chryseobacterium herbae]|nr:tetratricopeptide repeat-containing sensor histidine kinase [Chryseobacterium sp. pc1-10]
MINCNDSEKNIKKQKTPTTVEADKIFEEAKNQYNESENKKAFLSFSKAENIYKQNKDTLNIASSLIYKAFILNNIGDYYSSNERSVEALSLLSEPKDSAYLPSIYNNLAISEKNLKRYSESLKWYNKALNLNSDKQHQFTLENNIADLYTKLKQYSKSVKIYDSLLNDKNLQKNTINYARIFDNYNYSKWLENNTYNPENNLLYILDVKKELKDVPGQISTHSHLAEYYALLNTDKALYHTYEKYKLSDIIKNPIDKLESLQSLIELDKTQNTKKHFQEYKYLNDSIQSSKDEAKNSFALIEYDVEKKETENQQLKLKTAEDKIKIIIRNVGLGGLSLLVIGGFFWYRKRKKRLEQENELKIKENQLRISKKIHDVVANGIYQVMTKIENQEDFDKEHALDELEFVYEKSRDISYEKPDHENDKKDFKEKISTLIASFKNENTETYTVGNDAEIWACVSQSSFDEVYQVVREMLVNMKKHSQASRVIFKFERIDDSVKIQYTDDGIGIPGDMIYKNGLTNTGTRIAAINGAIIFDNKSEQGLKITISFPVS